MSRRQLNVGATVHFTRTVRIDAMPKAEAAVYRVEQLLKLPDGAMLYTIKSETEPFERVVSEYDLDRRG
jgi:hypothetical protein